MEYAVVVPTLNGGYSWKRAAKAIADQIPAPSEVLVIDSGSRDDTAAAARSHGFRVVGIDPTEFDHGRTRQWGAEQFPEHEAIVFLTQDAVLLQKDSIAQLLLGFEIQDVAAVYGRQIASHSASRFERHARSFNYPEQSAVKSLESVDRHGAKVAFCSNSFAAYRQNVLQLVGGFPDRTLFAEDMLVAAKMILAGYRVAYQAEAVCEHWHDYSIVQELQRAFDIGVFHHRERWILEEFGSASTEGGSLVWSGLKVIAAENVAELPKAICKYASKTLGYALGRAEAVLPTRMKRRLSMNHRFWEKS